MTKEKKQLRELSDQELEKVTGGGSGTSEPQCVNKDQNKPCHSPYIVEKDGRCCEMSIQRHYKELFSGLV